MHKGQGAAPFDKKKELLLSSFWLIFNVFFNLDDGAYVPFFLLLYSDNSH